MKFRIEFDWQEDGRWLGHVAALPDVTACGASKDEAGRQVKAVALRYMADRLEHGLDVPENVNHLFDLPANLAPEVTANTLSSLRTKPLAPPIPDRFSLSNAVSAV